MIGQTEVTIITPQCAQPAWHARIIHERNLISSDYVRCKITMCWSFSKRNKRKLVPHVEHSISARSARLRQAFLEAFLSCSQNSTLHSARLSTLSYFIYSVLLFHFALPLYFRYFLSIIIIVSIVVIIKCLEQYLSFFSYTILLFLYLCFSMLIPPPFLFASQLWCLQLWV